MPIFKKENINIPSNLIILPIIVIFNVTLFLLIACMNEENIASKQKRIKKGDKYLMQLALDTSLYKKESNG